MRQYKDIGAGDIDACAELLIDAYNREPWQNHWTTSKARTYLSEFRNAARFKGFLLTEDGRAVGAAFCHSRTWWTGDELYIDEFYIASDRQHMGLGTELMARIEQYVTGQKLKGITLLTNRHFPAMNFYLKCGFEPAEHVLFLYKTLN